MVQRSGGRGEDLQNKTELLRVLGQGRNAAIKAQMTVRPMGTTYHALAMVTSAIDALALFLTGNSVYFEDPRHRTPH